MDRTTVVTVGLCVVLLVVWFFAFGLPEASRTTAPSSVGVEKSGDSGTSSIDSDSDRAEPVADSHGDDDIATSGADSSERMLDHTPTDAGANAAALAYPVSMASSRRAAAEGVRRISDREYVTAEVDLERGGVIQVQLKRHLDAERSEPMRLGSLRTPFMRLVGEGVDWTGDTRLVADDVDSLIIERDTADGLTVREAWALDSSMPYRFGYTVEFVNRSSTSRTVRNFAVGAGGILPDDAASGAKMGQMGMMTLAADIAPSGSDAAVSLSAKKIGKLKTEQVAELAATPSDWVAVHNKYFIFFLSASAIDGMTDGDESFPGVSVGLTETAAAAAAADADAEAEAEATEGLSRLYGLAALPGFVLAPGEARTFDMTGYAGPKEYRRIRLLGRRVDSVLGMDFFFFGRAKWMGGLSRLVLRSLLKLHDWGLSYGLAIIVITLFVKGAFWPLTHKSTVSMRKMQEIQPLVKEVREKHKADPATMNQKIMALYKEHKVNPLGGCLPVVCQIPVFLALFNTFRGAIELRHTSFLWVADLSQPDTLPFAFFGLPIRPLPIIMGVCMLLQHHFGPSTADPNQKRMMMFMTIFFMFIFYSMPAGLTLYWTVNQLLTMVQHLMLRRADNQKKAAAAAA